VIRKAVVLPALFATVVAPLALFVSSGKGTHMSSLLLYPPAAPWWLFLPVDTGEQELGVLLLGCAINLVLLCLLGIAWDRFARRRARGNSE
jgi:hypothetical protein